MGAPLETILGYVLLSFGASFAGLMFNTGDSKKTANFKTGIRIMVGGFLFGNVLAYILYESSGTSNMLKKIIVAVVSMFGYKVYTTISSRLSTWLDLLADFKISLIKSKLPSTIKPEKDDTDNIEVPNQSDSLH